MYIDETGTLIIIEQLLGKAGAVAAMIFAIMILVWLPLTIFWEPSGAAVLGAFWAAEATLLVLVGNNTWRKTTVRANSFVFRIDFWSPLRQRQFIYSADRIAAVEVLQVAVLLDEQRFGHLLVTVRDNRPLSLFLGHDAAELAALAAQIQLALIRLPQT